MKPFIFPPFENHNGHLSLEKVDLVGLMDKFGSPLLVVSENRIREEDSGNHFHQTVLFD